jgi:hypothetical protein
VAAYCIPAVAACCGCLLHSCSGCMRLPTMPPSLPLLGCVAHDCSQAGDHLEGTLTNAPCCCCYMLCHVALQPQQAAHLVTSMSVQMLHIAPVRHGTLTQTDMVRAGYPWLGCMLANAPSKAHACCSSRTQCRHMTMTGRDCTTMCAHTPPAHCCPTC